MAVVITPILPAGHSQVMPAVSDCEFPSPGDTAPDSVCVCGGRSDTTTSVSVSVAQCPLSPLSVLSTCSSDVCLVAVEITPAKPRGGATAGATESAASGGAVSVKREALPTEGGVSDDHSSDCFVVDDGPVTVVASYGNSPEIVIAESDFFVDSQPIRQMQAEKEREVSATVLNSPSDSDLDPSHADYEADTAPTTTELIPLLLLDAGSDVSDTAASVSSSGSRSQQSLLSDTTKRRQTVDTDSRWRKVGQCPAEPIIISPLTKDPRVASSAYMCPEVTAGGASKRRIIEVTPTGDGCRQPLKKACLGKVLNSAIGEGEGMSAAGQDSALRSVVLVSQATDALGETTPMTSLATRRLQKKARSFEAPRLQPLTTTSYADTDLRTVIVNLRHEKSSKTNQRSISGKNRMEGDSWKVPGDGKNRIEGDGCKTLSRRGRSDSESSGWAGGVEEKGGDRKEGGDARIRLQSKNSRWDSESASRYSNGSRYTSRAKTSSSSLRRGQDVRSRLTLADTDDSRGRGGSYKVCRQLRLTVQRATVTSLGPLYGLLWPLCGLLHLSWIPQLTVFIVWINYVLVVTRPSLTLTDTTDLFTNTQLLTVVDCA